MGLNMGSSSAEIHEISERGPQISPLLPQAFLAASSPIPKPMLSCPAMLRLVQFCLVSSLFIVGSGVAVHAFDRRVDPNAVSGTGMTFTFSPTAMQALNDGADHVFADEKPNLPPEYAS